MALTRKSLKAMGLTDEQVDSIIEMHTETVDGLKQYKADAEKLAGVQKELDELKAKGDDGWKDKHDKLKKEFDDYKSEQTAKETHAAKEKAYRELLKTLNVSEKRIDSIIKVTDFDKIELDGDKVKDEATHSESIKKEWADFIVSTQQKGADTHNPPANNTKGNSGKSRADILGIRDGVERRRLMKENPDLFPELNIKSDE